MGPVEFAARYLVSRQLDSRLSAIEKKRILVQYVKDRKEMEQESARQLLREACDKAETMLSQRS